LTSSILLRSTTVGFASGPQITTAAAQPECTRKPTAAVCIEFSGAILKQKVAFEKKRE
jgi:hypothetical protein